MNTVGDEGGFAINRRLFNGLIIIQLNNFQKLDKQLDILDTNYAPLLEYFV